MKRNTRWIPSGERHGRPYTRGGPDARRDPFENYEPWSVAGPELGNEGVGVGKRLVGDCGAVVYVPETSRRRVLEPISDVPILGAIVAHVAPCRRRHR